MKYKPGDVLHSSDEGPPSWVGVVRETTRAHRENSLGKSNALPLSFKFPRDKNGWHLDGWLSDSSRAKRLHGAAARSVYLDFMKALLAHRGED